MNKLCECGCGSPAPLAKQTDRKRGYVKGEPMRFIAGHNISKPVQNVIRYCEFCGKEVELYPSDAKRFRFCSRKCQGLDLRYSNLSEQGSTRICHWGYRHVKQGDKWVREHRLVMETCLGRKLKEGEVVHHIDGNKLNNNISNLEIMSMEDHSRLHALERDFGSMRPTDIERDELGRFKAKQ